MKGAGSIINAFLIVMIMLFFFMIFLLATTSASQKKLELNLNSADFIKTKDTVSIVNRSLATTWYVSTVQLAFKAGDESVGCGYDDFFTLGADVAKKGYWYQYNDTRKQKSQDALQFEADDKGLPRKYNIRARAGGAVEITQPRICYPFDGDFERFFASKSAIYRDIVTSLEANGVGLAIELTGFRAFFDETGNIVSEASQNIRTESKTPQIITTTTNVNTVFTEFRNMMASGRSIVDKALADSDAVASRSSELLYTPQDTEQAYRQRVDARLRSNFASSLSSGKLAARAANKIELRAGDSGEVGFGADKQGLILHYDSGVSIAETLTGTQGGSLTCEVPRKQYEDIAISKVRIKGVDGKWTFGFFEYGESEIVHLIDGIIQAESNWDPNAVSRAGAIGLMQIIPASHTECPGDMRDPEANIECGTNFLYQLMGQISDEQPTDRGNLVKLALASYNAGYGRVKEYIACAGTSDWDSIVNQHAECVKKGNGQQNTETPNYVRLVLACFSFYEGGLEKVADYQWPLDSRDITSCFGLRPRPKPGATTDHKGVDIGAANGAPVYAATDGRIIELKQDCREGDERCGDGFGNFLTMQDGDGRTIYYAHLREGFADKANVEVLKNVARGEVIAEVGNTGVSTGPHLHFEVHELTKPLNPCNFIDCSQSTRKKCEGSLDAGIVEGLYYYNDEEQNAFTPRPFSLSLKVEDNLNALDCKKDVPEGFRLYSWLSGSDAACCGGALWACNLNPQLENIGSHGLSSGQRVRAQDDSAVACATIIDNLFPKTPDNPASHTLGCEAGGFTFVESSF